MFFGIAFSCFDFQQGPITVFISNLDEEFAKKINVKVLYSALAGHNSINVKEFVTGETITPLAEEQKIVFSFLFPYIDKNLSNDNIRVSTISLVFYNDEKNTLYQIASHLAEYCRTLAQNIQDLYIYGKPLPASIINQFLEIEKIYVEQKRALLSKKLEGITYLPKRTREKLPKLEVLRPFHHNGLDKIIEGIMTYRTLVFISNNSQTLEDAINAIKIFAPHRTLNIEKWTTDITDFTKDIICGPSSLINQTLKSSTIVCVNFETNLVFGGVSNSFIEEYFDRRSDIRQAFADSMFYTFVKKEMEDIFAKWMNEITIFSKTLIDYIADNSQNTQLKFSDLIKIFQNELVGRYSEAELSIFYKILTINSPKLLEHKDELQKAGINVFPQINYRITF